MKIKTAWHNTKHLPHSMLNAGFRPLSESDHFKSLEKCIKNCQGKTMIDIGCGLAEPYNAFGHLEYTGVDLPHMIQDVAIKNNPAANYISVDADETDFEFIKDYDIVLMNSFLSEMPSWYLTLNKILFHARGDVIIHRQEIGDGPSHLEEYRTYASLVTYKSVINEEELNNIFLLNDFAVVLKEQSFDHPTNQRTYLIRKDTSLE
jgi:hypothetical protein